MFIVELTYEEPIEKVEELLEDHIAWLNKYYAAGVFVASGRKVPRNGGIIFAKSMDRAELNRVLAFDPFNAVANYKVTEFAPSMSIPSLAELKTI
ncbi:YciI family protein [Acerihabitans sp. KWT182]|uniref:YciI family protein n=1 Tax=Acerihabitans sp. KWT182 TaxID=3157919 RepID=A0AAU7QCP7_9GAMM